MLQLIEISLICTGIYVCFMEGMFFYKLRAWIEVLINLILSVFFLHKKHGWATKCITITEWLIKPLYDCLPCMASFWTCIILWKIDIKAMLIVCGMNAIIASVLQFFDSSKFPE